MAIPVERYVPVEAVVVPDGLSATLVLLPPLPSGYVFVVDEDGAFVVDVDGAFLITGA